MYDVLGLVEDFALGTTATVGTVVDVGAAHVGDVVGQTRNTNGTEVEAITQLPRTFVLGIEVGPVGVGQQDGVATVAHAACVAIAAVRVADFAGAALVRQGHRVRAESVGACQAPDLVVLAVNLQHVTGVVFFYVSTVAVEIKRQGLFVLQRDCVGYAHVLLVQLVFHLGAVQGRRQVVGELVATAEHVDAFQVTAVACFSTFTRLCSETTDVDFQTVDLLGGQQGTGEAFRHQTRIVIHQHRQRRHLIAVLEHSVGHANLHRSASLGDVVSRFTAGALLEEIDTARAAVAATAIQTQCVDAESIHTHTYGALGEARSECAEETLAPFSFVLLVVFVVTADVGVARQYIEVAVFYKTFCVSLIVSHSLGSTEYAQSEKTYPFVQHIIFLISE